MSAALRSATAAWASLVVLRLAYLGQYLQLPFVFGPLFDSQVYLQQASAVRAGRLGDATLLAFSPLYGYVLAGLNARQGSLAPLVLQLALGLLNVWLMARVATALFGPRAGFWAAACFTLYGPILFFELKIMSETLGLTLLLLALERFTSAPFHRCELGASALAGIWIALSVLARASLLFTIPFFLGVAALRRGQVTSTRRPRLQRAACVLLGMVAVLGSYGSLTRAHSGVFVPVILVSQTAAQSSRVEWRGNLSDLVGSAPVSAFNVVEQAEERLAAIRRGEPDPAARSATQIDVWGWLAQAPAKAWLTMRDVETTFDYGYYGERSEAPALYLTFVTFGMLELRAALGLLSTFRKRDAGVLLPLLPVVLGVFAVTTLFHPSTRYRLPLVLSLAPLAGAALAEAEATLRVGDKRLAMSCLLIVSAFAVLGATRGLAHPAMWHLRVAESAAMAGDIPECRDRVRTALRTGSSDPQIVERARYVMRLQPACALHTRSVR